jgi:probable rRNA maturation factor
LWVSSPLRILEMPNLDGGKIRFHFLTKVAIHSRTAIKVVIQRILADHGKTVESISYVFCSDEYLLAINESYLKHDFYTDIITFDLSDRPDKVVADIYISVERVRDNARTAGLGFQEELVRVIFHGALHLSDLKDKRPLEIRAMRSAEKKYLEIFAQMFHVKQKRKQRFT